MSNSLTCLILDDNADIRDTATHLFNFIFKLKEFHLLPKPAYSALSLGEFNEESRYIDLTRISTANLGKINQGWTQLPDFIKSFEEFKNYQHDDSFFALISNPENAEKLLQFMVVKHQIETEKTQVSNPAAHSVSNAIEFLNNPAKLVNFMLESTPHNKSTQTGAQFSVSKAIFFSGIGKIYGPQAIKHLFDKARCYITKDKEHQIVITELLAGAFRSSKYWSQSSKTDYYHYFEEVVRDSALQASGSWVKAIDFMCRKQSPHSFLEMYRILVSKLSTSPSTKIRKLLKLLSKVVHFLGWKGIDIYPELISQLSSLPVDYFSSLRTWIGNLLGMIVSVTGRSLRNSQNTERLTAVIVNPSKTWAIFKPISDYIENIQNLDDPLYSHLLIDIYKQLFKIQDTDLNFASFVSYGIRSLVSLLESKDSKLSIESAAALAEFSSSKLLAGSFKEISDLLMSSEEIS